ncbi:cyclase family protein, partial [Streptomyces caniscabiei]
MALPAEFHDIAERVNNWGRWGADDEIGTLNLVTDEVVRRAVAEVRTGRR